jgi:hypothetical protein
MTLEVACCGWWATQRTVGEAAGVDDEGFFACCHFPLLRRVPTARHLSSKIDIVYIDVSKYKDIRYNHV